jgi:hypothetical protein
MDQRINQFLRHLDHIQPHRTFLEKLDIAIKVAHSKIEDMQHEIANTHPIDPQKLKDLTEEMMFQELIAQKLSKMVENNSRRSS